VRGGICRGVSSVYRLSKDDDKTVAAIINADDKSVTAAINADGKTLAKTM